MFEINTGQVDVWTLAIRTLGEAELASLLSPDELAKGRRFRFQKDRDLSWNARAALRILLGKYLKTAPADLRFEYESSGRPVLASGDLRFNVSHSGKRVAIAVARTEVGVDIEHRGEIEWTRKEAYLKALGVGLTGEAPPPDDTWTFFDLSDAEYAGTVAVRGPCPDFRRFTTST